MNARIVGALLTVIALASPAWAQNVRLEFAGKPRLVDCDGAPCFRMDVSALDAQGQPIALEDGAPFSVSWRDQDVPIIVSRTLRVVSSSTGSAAAQRARTRRVWFVLFDTSGSMNERLRGGETKFIVAKRQLERLFDTFQEGVDQMAIAPFDSQRVAERIRGVSFQTTKGGVRRQIENLQPRPRGNTALFSAVSEALDILKPVTREDAQISLVVFTDGKNDVNHASDDRGLLSGDAGLSAVKAQAQDVGVTIYTIGYGSPGVSFDEEALQALKFPTNASNYFNARDEAALARIFKGIQNRTGTAVRLLGGPLPVRREQLSGQSVVFRVTNGTLSTESPAWQGNPLMPPPFEGNLTADERRAWIGVSGKSAPPIPYLMRLLVLVVYSGLLAGLWFGLPRVIWPDRYIPKPAFHASPARAPQAQRPAPRPIAPQGRPQAGKPDVTIASPRPPARAGAGLPDRGRDIPQPGRTREASSAAARRSREPWGQREPSDATVFIPPSKKPGGRA